jgi:hypothetical protein
VLLAWWIAGAVASRAEGQLDPLLFLKSSRPYVVVALDLSSRMQRDLAGVYRDPAVYRRTGEAWEASLGVTTGTVDLQYRRTFISLHWMEAGAGVRAEAETIRIVGDRDSLFASFDRGTRLGIVRAGLARAIEQNSRSVAFGLVGSRQGQPAFDPVAVRVTRSPDPAQPSDSGMPGEWQALLVETAEPGGTLPRPPPLAAADAGGSSQMILQILGRGVLEPGALVAAGLETPAAGDAPILRLLEDAHAEASRLAAGDTGCRNTVVVLIAAGDQEPSLDPPLEARARDFLDSAGRRVPIHVISLASGGAAGRLAGVAAVTGGTYAEVETGAGVGDAEEAIHAVVRAVNRAVQHGLARFADVSVTPPAGQPFPAGSEYSIAAPLVGSVNLEAARSAQGQLLPGTRLTTAEGTVIPQASNVAITAGFALPGFEARVRAFRVYRPEPDAAAALGYRFVADGTRLWTAVPPAEGRRNLFTVIPGRGIVPFTEANAPVLASYLGVADPSALVRRIRGRSLGAVSHSTPALLTPPVEALADAEYAAFADANRDRRSLVFFGADDGMLHAVDARTGIEAWAVVPFNLLPRLKLLDDGQPIDAYRYYVAGSPRLADVRTSDGWKTILIVGEGAGGTFYQAFDVTLPGVGQVVRPDADAPDALLGWFAEPSRIPFLWSFPQYEHFDPAFAPYGDLSAGASEIEKSVGETWSTPSVFRFASGPSVAVVGSGPLPASVERQASRAGVPAGTSLYLIEAASGALLDSGRVASDGVGDDQESCAAAGCPGLKNALAADPSVLLGTGSLPARVYLGDLDGRLWRGDVRMGDTGIRFAGPLRLLYEGHAGEPIFSAAGLLRPGLDRTFVFVGTGSDLAPSTRASPPGRLLALEDTPAGARVRGEVALSSAGGGEERVSSLPAMAGDAVFFTTTFLGGTACDPGIGRLYSLTLGFGVACDWNRDGRRDAGDLVRLGVAGAGRASPPTVADGHVLVAAGGELRVFGDPGRYNQGQGFGGVRVLWWREGH